jgi:hypothetical protein
LNPVEIAKFRSMRRTGYLNPLYAASMGEFGRPLELSHSAGFLLQRAIPDTSRCDAMGLYPLFCCEDWSGLAADLEALRDRVISVVLVTDPFGDFDPPVLAGAFNHGLVPYKVHHVMDMQIPVAESACPHHRRNARKSLERLVVEEVSEPLRFLDTWCALYAELTTRHQINDLSRFSRRAFEIQLTIPGLVAFRAIEGDATVGMVLWYCQRDVAYYHLAAYSPQGYKHKASYGLFWTSAQRLRDRVRWLSLGAGAGASCDGDDGLTRFKKGWSSLVRPTYLGRYVARPEIYAELSRDFSGSKFFPQYRSPNAQFT